MKNVKQVGMQCLKVFPKNETALNGMLNWEVVSKQLTEWCNYGPEPQPVGVKWKDLISLISPGSEVRHHLLTIYSGVKKAQVQPQSNMSINIKLQWAIKSWETSFSITLIYILVSQFKMHIKVPGNSEDDSIWIIEPGEAMQCKHFSQILLNFRHLFPLYFKKAQFRSEKKSCLKMTDCWIGKSKWKQNSLLANDLTCNSEQQ